VSLTALRRSSQWLFEKDAAQGPRSQPPVPSPSGQPSHPRSHADESYEKCSLGGACVLRPAERLSRTPDTMPDGPNSVLERELPDAEIVISQPFWPAYLTGGVSEQYVDQLLNRTTMPRLTRCASSLASQFVMRTQPCEAFLSIFEGSGVPCRP
jgi:hypothetical protein